MKLDAARAIIVGAPNTHLAEAARTVLALLDACDLDRTEAAEAHLSVQAEALATAREEAEVTEARLFRCERATEMWKASCKTANELLRKVAAENTRLSNELEEARQPDKDLYRLRALEHAAELLRDAYPPVGTAGRGVYDRIMTYLTPHLEGPKLGP